MELNKLVLHALDRKTVENSPIAKKALQDVIVTVRGTREYLDLVWRYGIRSENNHLLDLSIEKNREETGRDAAGLLLELGGERIVRQALMDKDTTRSYALLNALGGVGSKKSIDILQGYALSGKYPMQIRKIAAAKIGRSWEGKKGCWRY